MEDMEDLEALMAQNDDYWATGPGVYVVHDVCCQGVGVLSTCIA